MQELIYQSAPIVTLATNTFINVPIVFQYEETPLIEVIREQNLGFMSSIPIYHQDGTYLAKVNGTRIYPTEKGKLAGITIEKHSDVTVCMLGGKVAFEVHHHGGDSFKLLAELFAPDGYFVRIRDNPLPSLIDVNGNTLSVRGVSMTNCTFKNLRIGIWLKKDGSCRLGCS